MSNGDKPQTPPASTGTATESGAGTGTDTATGTGTETGTDTGTSTGHTGTVTPAGGTDKPPQTRLR